MDAAIKREREEGPVMTNIVLFALAICLRVESQGYTAANVPDGDGGRAVGVYQQWPIAVDEANRIAGRKLWSYDDRRNPQLARAMALVTFEHHYRRGDTDVVRLTARHHRPYGELDAGYVAKVERAYRELLQR